MVFVVERVQFQYLGIGVVVPDQEAVLLTPQPPLLAWEHHALGLSVEFKLDSVALGHVRLQLDRFLAEKS